MLYVPSVLCCSAALVYAKYMQQHKDLYAKYSSVDDLGYES